MISRFARTLASHQNQAQQLSINGPIIVRSAVRSLSSYPGGGGSGGSPQAGGASAGIGGLPSYSVFGEECLLVMKPMLPTFRRLGNDALTIDKKGRMLFEWCPRKSTGGLDDKETRVRFALSPEEMGLFLDQLPQYEVVLQRMAPSQGGAVMNEGVPEKVFRATPGSGGTVSLLVEMVGFNNDQAPSSSVYEASGVPSLGPLQVIMQLGEFTVMQEIMRSSIPALAGWSTLMEVAMKRNLNDAISGRYYQGGGGGGRPGGYTPRGGNSGGGYGGDSQLPF